MAVKNLHSERHIGRSLRIYLQEMPLVKTFCLGMLKAYRRGFLRRKMEVRLWFLGIFPWDLA